MKEFNPYTYVPVDHDPFAGPELERSAPTTEPQKEIWASMKMSPDASRAYNESITLCLKGAVDAEKMKEALQLLIERHEGLRCTFSPNGASMKVLKAMDAAISEHQAADEKAFEALVLEDQNRDFDIENGPLFRSMLIQMPGEIRLVMNAHHLICDGWSMGVMMADLSTLYSALVKGESPRLEPAYGFSQYAVDQIELMASTEYKEIEQRWLQRFEDGAPELDLPTDRPRPEPRTYAGARVDVELEQDIVQGIKQIGTAHASSFVTTLLSAFEVYLSRLTGQTDIILGLPAAGQSDTGHHYLVGHCVNLLALRSEVDGSGSFVDHLKKRKKGILDAFDDQKYTFGSLLQKLALPRKPGRIPLVPVVFNIDMNMDDGVAFEGLEHSWLSNPRTAENFELFLNATGSEEKLILEWSYKTDLFDEATIRSMMAGFRDLLKELIAEPEKALGGPSAAKEQHATTVLPYDPKWSGERRELPQKSVAELFRESAKENAERTALVLGNESMAYGELDKLSESLAATLIEKGIQPGALVGISMERSFEMVIGMLAILKAGAAFVPFDPGYPKERLEFMFEDTQVSLLLCDELTALDVPLPEERTLIVKREHLDMAEQVQVNGGPEDLAYIMYTSGSTGQPKGVSVPNRAITRLVRNTNFMEFSQDLVFLQLSNISFDASTLELWGALLNGAKLVLMPEQKPTLSQIVDAIHQHGITTVWFTAGLFNLLVDEHLIGLSTLKHILTGGDVLSVPHVSKALEALGPGVLINGYGPTENTTFTCCYPINDLDDIPGSIPIGYPITNTQVYILDKDGQPVGAGEEGELYTGGEGLALGYWKREELTAEKFVPNPFSDKPDAKMYRTGDLVRWMPDGRVEFIGRVDNQIKLRGFRVELGEIEAALLEHPLVKNGAVICREDRPGDKQVVAYCVAQNEEGKQPDEGLLRSTVERDLKASLPEYMVPAAIVVMDQLPLNANDKIDRKALPAPAGRTHDTQTNYEAPRNHLERSLASIWQQLLGVEQIGIHDNFFELGGHSLLGISMFEQIKQQYNQELSLAALFQAPTVAKLAKQLEDGGFEQQWENLSPVQPKGELPPFFCVHGDEANYFIPRYLGEEQPFFAFFHQGEDGSRIKYTNVEELAAHFIQELKTVRPQGPYNLGGYSFGGIVAYEMAQQLKAAGDEVGLLAMIDTAEPEEHARSMDEEKKFYDPIKKAIMRPIAQRYLNADKPLPPKLRHFYIIDTYDKAIHAYAAKKYDGDLVLFRAKATTGDPEMGWGKFVSGKVIVHEVPGDHYSLIKEPDVRQLAEKLGEYLDQVHKRNSVEVA